jgi:hypothetical protein
MKLLNGGIRLTPNCELFSVRRQCTLLAKAKRLPPTAHDRSEHLASCELGVW